MTTSKHAVVVAALLSTASVLAYDAEAWACSGACTVDDVTSDCATMAKKRKWQLKQQGLSGG